jgi:hypothetical protein
MVEQVLKESGGINREELKRKLPVKIMHQTLNLILKYLEEKKIIEDSHNGITWVYNLAQIGEPNKKKELEKIIPIISRIIKKFGIKRAGIFGSYARREQRADSDIDILVEFRGKKSLFDLINLELLLQKTLKKKVDLLTYNSINPLLKKKILKEEVRII